MKISIITSTFNCENELKRTIDSIRKLKALSLVVIEWIVVDGASTDNTIKLLHENRLIIDYIQSEPDNGIYDAWNKACKFITGEWILFLGAGDVILVENFNNFYQSLSSVDYNKNSIVYGNVHLVNYGGYVKLTYKKIKDNDWINGRPALPCHQGTFQHKSLFSSSAPNFDDSYKIAADSKFLLFSMRQTELYYINVDIAEMQLYGVSTSPKNILKVKRELDKLRDELDIKMPFKENFIFNFRCYVKSFIANVGGDKIFKFIAKIFTKVSKKENIY
jgi:glycosyltransferase involved in cell wall biosynthesis